MITTWYDTLRGPMIHFTAHARVDVIHFLLSEMFDLEHGGFVHGGAGVEGGRFGWIIENIEQKRGVVYLLASASKLTVSLVMTP